MRFFLFLISISLFTVCKHSINKESKIAGASEKIGELTVTGSYSIPERSDIANRVSALAVSNRFIYVGFLTGQLYRMGLKGEQPTLMTTFHTIRGLSIQPGTNNLFISAQKQGCNWNELSQEDLDRYLHELNFAGIGEKLKDLGGIYRILNADSESSDEELLGGLMSCDTEGGWHMVNGHAWQDANHLIFGVGSKLKFYAGNAHNNYAGTILKLNVLNKSITKLAAGVRNPYGLAIASNNKLYVNDNGPQIFEGDQPAEPIYSFSIGDFKYFGYPVCWWLISRNQDCAYDRVAAEFKEIGVDSNYEEVNDIDKPTYFLDPHLAPTGMAFLNGYIYTGVYGRAQMYAYPENGGDRITYNTSGPVIALAVDPNGSALYTAVQASGNESTAVIYRMDLGSPTNNTTIVPVTDLEQGEKLYSEKGCIGCHSAGIQGAPNILEDKEYTSDFVKRKLSTEIPPFMKDIASALSDEEKNLLALYISTKSVENSAQKSENTGFTGTTVIPELNSPCSNFLTWTTCLYDNGSVCESGVCSKKACVNGIVQDCKNPCIPTGIAKTHDKCENSDQADLSQFKVLECKPMEDGVNLRYLSEPYGVAKIVNKNTAIMLFQDISAKAFLNRNDFVEVALIEDSSQRYYIAREYINCFAEFKG